MSHNAVKGDEEAPKVPLILKELLLCAAITAIIVAIGSVIVVSVLRK